MIRAEANPAANLIWGATFDETLEDEIKITVIATGFDSFKKEDAEEASNDSASTNGASTNGDIGSDMDDLIRMLNGNK